MKKNGNDTIVGLRLKLPNSCARIQEVKVVDSGKRAFAILPIVEFAKNFPDCPSEPELSTVEVNLGNLEAGRYLFHVRSMHGDSKNLVKDIF